MPYILKKGDLVEMEVDAIVNASNTRLVMVEGVGRAIFHKAGDLEMRNACKAIGGCPLGGAVLTPSFNIKNCKGIIHAVGPNFINGKHGEEKNLRNAYRSSFKICKEQGFTSVAFPLLSQEFNFPSDLAYNIAESEILSYLKENPEHYVYIVIFKNFPEIISDNVREAIKKYLITNYQYKEPLTLDSIDYDRAPKFIKKVALNKGISLDDLAHNANYTIGTASEILSGEKRLSLNEVCAFSVSLHLSVEEFEQLLEIAGYNNIESNITSTVASLFLGKEIYDVYRINRVLFTYDLPLLGIEK